MRKKNAGELPPNLWQYGNFHGERDDEPVDLEKCSLFYTMFKRKPCIKNLDQSSRVRPYFWHVVMVKGAAFSEVSTRRASSLKLGTWIAGENSKN